jgi:hypothetical protein
MENEDKAARYKKYQKEWRTRNPDYMKQWYASRLSEEARQEYARKRKERYVAIDRSATAEYRKYWRQTILSGIKRRSRKREWVCDLTPADLMVPACCPVLGIPLVIGGEGEGRQGPTPNSPSVDRIDNSLGYIRGNVKIISWRANSLKRDATPGELRKIADWMEANEF